MNNGTYTNITLLNGLVHKKIMPNSIAEKKILELIGKDNITPYINRIKGIVKLPNLCYYNDENEEIVQDFIDLPNIDEYLSKVDIFNDNVVKIFENLTKIYSNVKKCKDVTIDFNLLNFLVGKDELIYVDVVPPLFKNDIKKINKKEFESQKQLFLNYELQLKSMICYFLQPFIIKNESKQNLKLLYLKLKDILKTCGVADDLSKKFNHIFSYRFEILIEYLFDKETENFSTRFMEIDIKNDLNKYKGC